jgi:WD40 repeat protein
MPGPVPARVAQLTVTHGQGGRRLGSGYLVADGVVLTAGHVLDGASAVLATFEPNQPGRRRVDAIAWWADLDADIGIVEIAPWAVDAGGEPLPPADFGRLPDSTEVVDVVAVGFPRWKMRNADGTVPADGDGKRRFRESAHIVGISPLQSNARLRSLEVVLTAPPAESADGRSPWEGMSGAALWVGEHIVGVVAQHHPAEGLARLAAVRMDGALDRLAPDRSAELGLPASVMALPDVTARRSEPRVPSMAPAVLAATTARPDLQAVLQEHLKPALNEVVSIEGAGGFGKTTLATMVARDPLVVQRFTGGVLWVTLGERASGARLAELIGGLCEALSGDRVRSADPQVAGGRLGELLSEREPALLVIDDVWRPEQLAPFLIGGWSGQRLITTRNAGVAPRGAVSVVVDAMTDDQAVVTLTRGLPEVPGGLLGRLLAATGRWPLLLSLVNAAFAEQLVVGADVAEVAAWILGQLEAAGPAVFDADLGRERDRSRAVEVTLEMSLALLGPAGIDRYLDLAVLPDGSELPADLLAGFWGTAGMAAREAEKLRTRLVRLRLVQPGWHDGAPTLRLHDVIRTYLRHRMTPEELAARHERMVDTADVLADSWWDLPKNAAYLWQNLPYHLVHAGREADRDALVCDLRWVAAKIDVLGTSVPAEVDLADVSAPVAHALRSALGSIAWLLAPSDPESALGATLHAYLSGVPELETLVAAYGHHLPGPHLVPQWPLPDLPRHGLVRTLTGHTNGVSHCAYSRDGSLIATTSNDRTARVWDATTGATLRVFTGHNGPVSTCDVSVDATLLVTGGHDRSVRLWDIATGAQRAVLAGHSLRVTSCRFAPDGTTLATTGYDQMAILWDIRTGTPQRHLLHPSPVLSCAFSPNGASVATVCEDGSSRVWNVRTGVQQALLDGSAAVLACAFSPDGAVLVTAGADHNVTLWDCATRTRSRVLRGHTDTVTGCAFSPDGTLIASAGHDLSTRIWDAASGEARATLTNSQSATSCAFSPDGRLLAVADHDWEVMIWQADLTTRQDHQLQWEYTCAFAPDGATVATAGYDRAVRIWQVPSGELAHVLKGHTDIVAGVAFSTDGRLLATASHDRTIRIWDAATGATRLVLDGHTDAVVSVDFAPNDACIVSAGHDDTVRIWDAASGEPLRTLTGHTGAVAACTFSPDGSLIASTSHDHTLRIWDAETGQVRHVLTGHTDLVSGCAFAPDGTLAASASHDRTCRIWDVETGALRQVLARHGTGVADCVFTPDGSLMSTDIHDCRLTAWHVGDTEPWSGLRVMTPLLRLAWHPSEPLLCAVGESGVYLLRMVAGA